MSYDNPLPLIQPSVDFEDSDADLDQSATLYWYGYAVLALSWSLFIITANSVFRCWIYVIDPLSRSENTKRTYDYLYWLFQNIDEYVISFWCLYVVAWWWALISWCALKLFKQSKGIQT